MKHIPIGTIVKGSENPAAEILKLAPYGFESFSIMFWQHTGGVDLLALADQVGYSIDTTSTTLSSLSIYGNVLDKSEIGQRTLSDLRLLIELAPQLDVPVVSCFAGRVPGSSVTDSIARWHEVFAPLADRAGELGITIAFENCRLGDTWKRGKWNIAINPDAWELMFGALSSPVIGLEWEPCHQVEALAEVLPQLKQWLPRILHIHGKDSRIDWKSIGERGLYGGGSWHESCLPGFGDTDWEALFYTLYEGGYRGTVDIEGWNDANYSGEREIEGQRKALAYLKGARGGMSVETSQ